MSLEGLILSEGKLRSNESGGEGNLVGNALEGEEGGGTVTVM